MGNTPATPKSFKALFHAQHIDHTISPLDALPNLDVLWVFGIEFVRHKPFVDAKDTTGLQYTCDLCIDCLQRGRIDGSFGSIDEVEVVVGKGNMLYQESEDRSGYREEKTEITNHKVTFPILDLPWSVPEQAFFFRIFRRSPVANPTVSISLLQLCPWAFLFPTPRSSDLLSFPIIRLRCRQLLTAHVNH